jgi:hypothetical protein
MKSSLCKCVLPILLASYMLCIYCSRNKSTRPDDDVSNRDFVARESFYFAVDAEDHGRLRLQGINGNVAITALSGADSVIITGERRVGSESMQDAEDHLTELQVEVSDLFSEVQIKTIQPDETHGRSYVVDYDITLPQNMDVVVSNVNGIVMVEFVNGSVSVQNVNGQVVLNDIFGSVSVSLVNGLIEAEVTLPTAGTIGMSTVNGGIALDIPQSTSADFSAGVVNGTIVISGLVLTDLVSTPYSLTGTLGDGKGTIGLSTVNGSIIVSGF